VRGDEPAQEADQPAAMLVVVTVIAVRMTMLMVVRAVVVFLIVVRMSLVLVVVPVGLVRGRVLGSLVVHVAVRILRVRVIVPVGLVRVRVIVPVVVRVIVGWADRVITPGGQRGRSSLRSAAAGVTIRTVRAFPSAPRCPRMRGRIRQKYQVGQEWCFT
jgi:hypothetical protein